jgi:hypothetical protein
VTARKSVDVNKVSKVSEWYDAAIQNPEKLRLPELRAFRDWLEQERTTGPVHFRSAFGLLWRAINERIDAIEDDDDEGLSMSRKVLQKAPVWVREIGQIREILTHIEMSDDPRERLVIEWHRVPNHLRGATASLASALLDAADGQGRPGGRAKKLQT